MIFSASAGSGKTYTLARQVIDLLVADPRSYAHILAVTFTNKATGEMKDRIVGDLDIMANGPDGNKGREALLAAHVAMAQAHGDGKMDRQKVIERSALALRNILLDYGQFSVSTIDSFVQRVIRSFAYEQGLPSNYGLQLDTASVISGAVDDLMDSMSVDADLRRLVISMTEEAIDSDKTWGRAEKSISDIGKELLDEGARVDYEMLTLGNIAKLRDAMQDRQECAAKSVLRIVSTVRERYNACGISGTNGKMKKFARLIVDDLPHWDVSSPANRRNVMRRVDKYVDTLTGLEPSRLITKKTKGDVDAYTEVLTASIEEMSEIQRDLNTCGSVLANVNTLGVMSRLADFIRGIEDRNNKVNMSGSGKLLADLIDGCPVPFVYEKIGVRYDTIMIDEFQDTSATQYGNFYPLLDESLAEDHDCLIVGDVKQSIYRFRGGDWKLLHQQVPSDFRSQADLRPLTENYRSKSQVVNFNNTLFAHLPKAMEAMLYTGGFANRLTLSEMYEGAAQQPKKGDDGYVHVEMVQAKEDDTAAAHKYTQDQFVLALKSALDHGYSYSDICILIRKSQEAQVILERLASETWNGLPIPIMSDDSLYVMSSDATRCISEVMHYLVTGERAPLFAALRILRGVSEERLGEEFAHNRELGDEIDELRGLGILELIGEVVNRLPKKLRDEDALFIDAFRQQVMEAVKDGDADLSSFVRRVDDNLTKWTVWATSSRPAVKIMTIHKSKGLEFKVVLIPNADWEFEANKGKELIWCPADRLGLPSWQGGVLPVTFNAKLANSDFADDYIAERELVYADNLNLVYVAFTRPREVLYAWGVYQKPQKSDEPSADELSSTGALSKYIVAAFGEMEADGAKVNIDELYVYEDGSVAAEMHAQNDSETEDEIETIKNTDPNAEVELPNARHLDRLVYEDGEMPTVTAEPEAESSVRQMNVEMPFASDAAARYKINAEAESRIISDIEDDTEADGPTRALMISTGLTNHGILERVRSIDDLHRSVRRSVIQGALSQADADAREAEMRQKITDNLTVAEWFDSEKVKKVWTETSMVGPAPDASPLPFVRRRPDRVMRMMDGRTVLVDYKFGKRNKKHHGQVREYLQWLQYAGFERVEAYLWYFPENVVESVSL